MYFNNSQNNGTSSVDNKCEEVIEQNINQLTIDDYLDVINFCEELDEISDKLNEISEELDEINKETKKLIKEKNKARAIMLSVVSGEYRNIDEAIEQLKEIQ